MVPFLCFALLTYGLLPRIMLLFLAAYRQISGLARLQLDQAVFDRLLARMKTPLVTTQAEPEGRKGYDATEPDHMFEQSVGTARNRRTGIRP